jgi:plasmid stabilization system protein ParE
MTNDELYAKGRNGQITVSGGWVTIERKGLGRMGHSKGDRRIPLTSIMAVQMRPAGSLANGFLKFTVPGSPEIRGGLNAATSDENAVIFTKKQQKDFDAIRARIEDYIEERNAPQGAAASAPDIPDQIKKLGELRDSGVLSDDEFEAKKAELLRRL